jgi:small GTP-binding protein
MASSGFINLKIIVVGAPYTGKTNYVNKWTKDIFTDGYKATVVSEFGFRVFEHNEKLYRIQLWDLAGKDEDKSLAKIFSKDSHGCVVLSDATNSETREE